MPPLPKRSRERRRANKVPGETIISRTGEVKPPRLPAHLHPVARNWFNALKQSGQNEFFEPSDWQAAVFLAMKLSAHLSTDGFAMRLLALAKALDEQNDPVLVATELREMSLNTPRGTASEFAAIWAAMESLLTTESSRRRARLEVERAAPEPVGQGPTAMDKYRERLAK